MYDDLDRPPEGFAPTVEPVVPPEEAAAQFSLAGLAGLFTFVITMGLTGRLVGPAIALPAGVGVAYWIMRPVMTAQIRQALGIFGWAVALIVLLLS